MLVKRSKNKIDQAYQKPGTPKIFSEVSVIFVAE
jgi:hypothetical protein